MKLYRIGRTRYAKDLTGEGARLHGGRWNHTLSSCIYTSESRALAVLEFTVNVNIDDIPRALSVTTYETGDAEIFSVKIADLPGDWLSFPAPSSTKTFGSLLLSKAEFPVIKIPSAVVAEEWNYMLNPLHPDFRKIKIVSLKDFVYDIRIKNI